MTKNNNLRYILGGIIVIVALIFFFQIWNNYLHPQILLEADFFAPAEGLTATSFGPASWIGEIPALPTKLPTLQVNLVPVDGLRQRLNTYCVTNDTTGASATGEVCNYYQDENEIFVAMSESNLTETDFELELVLASATNFLAALYPETSGNFELTNIYLPLNDDYLITDEIQEWWTADELEDDELFDEDEDPVPFLEGEPAQVRFLPTAEGIVLSHREQRANAWQLTVGTDYQVTTAVIPTIEYQLDRQRSLKLLTLEQALANLSQGYGYLDYDFLVDDLNVNRLDELTFSQVKLEYRLTNDDTLAIPCYHLVGTALNSIGEQIYVEAVTPAVPFRVAS